MRKWPLLFFLIICHFIFGQQDSIYILPEIELTSHSVPTDSITLKEGKNIVIGNERVLYSDVSGYLVQLPGVTIKEYGSVGGLKTVQVRGINAGLSTILLDGMKIPNSNTGQVDISKIPYRGIQHITFNNYLPLSLELPASSYNGNGFVSLHSTPLTDSIITGIKHGSNRLVNPFVHISRNKKNKLNLSIDHLHSKGNFPFTDINKKERIRENNTLNNTSILGSYTFLINKKTSLKIQQSINIGEQQLPGAIILNRDQDTKQHLSNHHYNSSVTFKRMIKNWKLSSYLSNYIQRTHYKDPNFLNSTNGISNIYNEQNNLAALNISRKWKKTRLFISSDLERNSLTTNTNISVSRYISNTIIGTSYQTKKINIQLSALALSTSLKNQESNNPLFPSIVITYKPVKKIPIKVRNFYKSYYRIPSFSELYYQQVGNENLQKEEAKQFNVGIYSELKNKKYSLYLSADIFHIIHQNKIVAIPTQNLFVWSYLNIGKVKSSGLELYTHLLTTLNTNSTLSITGAYTKQFSQDISTHVSANKDKQLPYIPFDVITGTLDYKYKKLSINYQYRYNGFRFFHFENTFTNVLPSFHIHNLVLSYAFKHKKNSLLTSIGLKNLNNTQYSIIRSFPMPPRQLYLQISYHL